MATGKQPKVLEVVLDALHAGRLIQDTHGQLSFTYDDQYRQLDDPTPLSLSMRPTRREHPHRVVDPWLRGLLPDSDAVLARWAARFKVSANSPFALLTHVGEDVAGAAQFVTPERLESVTSGGELDWIETDYIAERLAVLRADRAAWSDVNSPGQFSLAGAQSKFALYRDPASSQWAIPAGRHATTHIIKPALPDLADQDINEHLCLVAARNLGLNAAHSEVMEFDGERAIVLERYDRTFVEGELVRIHQEDFCQALGLPPTDKYERGDDGTRGRGPGIVDIIEVMRTVQSVRAWRESARHYVSALAYNWLIYAPDAHAKNYSVLLAGADAEPSPLYDISSVLPYPATNRLGEGFELRTMMTAMSVNRKYQNNLVVGDDWVALGNALRLDGAEVLSCVLDLAERVPDAFADAARAESTKVSDLSVVTRLVDGVATYSQRLRSNLATSGNLVPRRTQP
jgi:serine/threonine-protein kinase HipA